MCQFEKALRILNVNSEKKKLLKSNETNPIMLILISYCDRTHSANVILYVFNPFVKHHIFQTTFIHTRKISRKRNRRIDINSPILHLIKDFIR